MDDLAVRNGYGAGASCTSMADAGLPDADQSDSCGFAAHRPDSSGYRLSLP
jgi:hypothetical protein